MHKLILFGLVFILIGCSLQVPYIVTTDNVTVIQRLPEGGPNTNGVLHLKVKGCRYSYDLIPTTQPVTKPKASMTPITQEPIFDFFKDKQNNNRKFFEHATNSSGSCFVVAKQNGYYYAITARHVVQLPKAKITIDGQKGEIVSILNRVDAAIIRFKSNKKYPIYKLSENAKILDTVWLVGFPGDVTGIVRKFTVKGSICNVSKTEIWFSGGGAQGMSGGPMINSRNEVFGVISRFISTLQPCDNFVDNVPSRFFMYELESILIKERIKNLTKKS